MKATATYIEKNHRLELNDRRTKTLEITDPWDPDKTCEEIRAAIRYRVQKDSTVKIVSYKVGSRIFQGF